MVAQAEKKRCEANALGAAVLIDAVSCNGAWSVLTAIVG